MKVLLRTLGLVILMSFVYTPFAYAYMDPGTGSYLFQIIIAGAIGGLFVVKSSWGKIIGYMKRIRGRQNN